MSSFTFAPLLKTGFFFEYPTTEIVIDNLLNKMYHHQPKKYYIFFVLVLKLILF